MEKNVFHNSTNKIELKKCCDKQEIVRAVKEVWQILEWNNISKNDIIAGKWRTNYPELLEFYDSKIYNTTSFGKNHKSKISQREIALIRIILIEDFLINGILEHNKHDFVFIKHVAFPDMNFVMKLFYDYSDF